MAAGSPLHGDGGNHSDSLALDHRQPFIYQPVQLLQLRYLFISTTGHGHLHACTTWSDSQTAGFRSESGPGILKPHPLSNHMTKSDCHVISLLDRQKSTADGPGSHEPANREKRAPRRGQVNKTGGVSHRIRSSDPCTQFLGGEATWPISIRSCGDSTGL